MNSSRFYLLVVIVLCVAPYVFMQQRVLAQTTTANSETSTDIFQGDRSSAEETLKQFLALIDQPDAAMAFSLVSGDQTEKEVGARLLLGVAQMHQATLKLEKAAIKKYGAEEVKKSPMFTLTLPRENVMSAYEDVTWQASGDDIVGLIKVGPDFFQLPMKRDAGAWRIDAMRMGQSTGGAELTGKLFGVLSKVMTQALVLVEQEADFGSFRQKVDTITQREMAPVMAQAMKDVERRREAQARELLEESKLKFSGKTIPQKEMSKVTRLISQAYQSGNAEQVMSLIHAEDVAGETARVFYGSLVQLGGTWDLMIQRVEAKFGKPAAEQIEKWDMVASGVISLRQLLLETNERKQNDKGFVFSKNGHPLFMLTQVEGGWLVDGQQMAGNLENLDLELLFVQGVNMTYQSMSARIDAFDNADAFIMELQLRTTQQVAPILAEMERRRAGNQ